MTQTEQLDNAPFGTSRAVEILKGGGLVAFPTETVYGLGADACNGEAVARIYDAKGRPSFNPLIAHVANMEMAESFAKFSDVALRLARAFWPGPLTLVLPLKPHCGLSSLVTAGLDTVALRVPNHPTARQILEQFGGPIAAPSANPSGRISPTTAQHVIDGLDGRIDAVLDAGPCKVGVESTIIGFAPDPVLLRAGGVSVEDIENVLGGSIVTPTVTNDANPNAPGQLSSHYAPAASVRLNAVEILAGETLLGFGKVDGAALNLSPSGDLVEAAANLFDHLHRLDTGETTKIAVSPIPETGLGLAINDRLRRAAAPR